MSKRYHSFSGFTVLLGIIIALSLLLTSCSRRSRIVGTWHDNSGFAMVFHPDGSFTSGQDTNQYAGIWRMSGQTLVMTLTNATGPHPGGKVGDTVRFRIVRLDSHLLSLKIGGQTNSLSR